MIKHALGNPVVEGSQLLHSAGQGPFASAFASRLASTPPDDDVEDDDDEASPLDEEEDDVVEPDELVDPDEDDDADEEPDEAEEPVGGRLLDEPLLPPSLPSALPPTSRPHPGTALIHATVAAAITHAVAIDRPRMCEA